MVPAPGPCPPLRRPPSCRGSCHPGRRNFPESASRAIRDRPAFSRTPDRERSRPPSSGARTWSGSCRPESAWPRPEASLVLQKIRNPTYVPPFCRWGILRLEAAQIHVSGTIKAFRRASAANRDTAGCALDSRVRTATIGASKSAINRRTAHMEHKDLVREEFTRQAPAYAESPVIKDPLHLDKLVEAVRPAPEARALEIATGPGHVALAFARVCREVV